MILNICLNRRDQLLDALEHSPADSLVGDLAKPAFDQVQPGTARRNEGRLETAVTLQP